MTAHKNFSALAVAFLLMAGSAAAQQTISSNDIQRLQDEVYRASSDVSRLRSTDASLATRLEGELDELRDEVTYLKVRLRKEGSVSRNDYSDLRDRVQQLRSRARGESTGGYTAAPVERDRSSGSGITGGTTGSGGVSGGTYEGRRDERRQTSGGTAIPEGQEIDVRLLTQLSSDTAQVEDRFEAVTVVDLHRGNDLLIPAGSTLRGVVSSVNRASRTDRKGQLTVAFDQITVNGRNYPMRGTVTQALESEGIRGEAGRIGAGSAVGAIIGGIMGGMRGALLGVLIGGGGTIAATEGKDVTLPPGTILRVSLDSPPNVR